MNANTENETTAPDGEDMRKFIESEMARMHERVLAFRARYYKMRDRQKLVQHMASGVGLGLVVDAIMHDQTARAFLAGAVVIIVNLFPILPRDPRGLIDGE